MSDPKRTSEIKMTIRLDDENVPVDIKWEASDDDSQKEAKPCKAMLLSIFDGETHDTMKIDLWTKEMQVVEMDRFIFQTLRAMADTYHRATQNNKLANDMQKFAQYFGEQTETIPKN